MHWLAIAWVLGPHGGQNHLPFPRKQAAFVFLRHTAHVLGLVAVESYAESSSTSTSKCHHEYISYVLDEMPLGNHPLPCSL